jgi:hypothetical protein
VKNSITLKSACCFTPWKRASAAHPLEKRLTFHLFVKNTCRFSLENAPTAQPLKKALKVTQYSPL